MAQDQIEVKMKLAAIELLDSEIHMPRTPDFKLEKVNYNLNLEAKVNPVDKFIFNITTVEARNELDNFLLAKVTVNLVFNIENFEEVIKPKKDSFDIPELLVVIFNNISISTVRGIMFERFRGTILHNFPLPIIDPQKMQLQKK